MLVTRGLERVLGDLTALGYDTKWLVMGASDVGANHQRDRIWILGYTNNNGQITSKITKSITQGSDCDTTGKEQTSKFERPNQQYAKLAKISNANSTQFKRMQCSKRSITERAEFGFSRWWKSEPNVGRVADGVAARVDRLKAIGNGQVPLCAATAWRILNA